jgi:hypothetical protein
LSIGKSAAHFRRLALDIAPGGGRAPVARRRQRGRHLAVAGSWRAGGGYGRARRDRGAYLSALAT